MNDVANIKESDIKIEGKSWESEDVRRLWGKNQMIFTGLTDFWKPLMMQGKELFNYIHGNIFDDNIRAQYEQVYGKIPIEPRIMKMRINTLVGHMKNTLRTGKVTSESGMSANELSAANGLLKYFENEMDEEFLMNEMLVNGITCCMPQCLWFDLTKTAYGNQMAGLISDVLPWDSFVAEKYFRKADGEDVQTICRVMRQSKDELIDENSNREEAIKDHYKQISDGTFEDLLEMTSGFTVTDARNLWFDVIAGIRYTKLDGKELVIERLSPLKVKQEVAIRMDSFDDKTLDYQLRPGTWSDDRWLAWKREHSQQYTYIEKDVDVLWQSRWTSSGLMLQNRVHWFQEHDKRGNPILPIALFTPQIIDGIPTGPGADMKHKILMKAISETEYLHDVRTGAGDMFVYRSGHIMNFQDLPRELSEGNGIAIIDDQKLGSKSLADAVQVLKRTPNQSHKDYSEKIDRDLEQTDLVTPPVMGQHAPRQANKAKQTEIAQALLGYSVITDNYNKSYRRVKNIECMLIPYVFTKEQTIVIQDEDDKNKEPEKLIVNEEEFDVEGNSSIIANNLSDVHWKWRLVEGDDSPTQRQAELKEMLIFWNTAAPSLIEADESLVMLASVLKSMGNKTANKMGALLEEKAKVKAEQLSQQEMAKLMAELEEKRAKMDADKIKAMRSGFSFSVTAEDLSTDPEMYHMLVEHGYINESQNNNFQLPEAAEAIAA